MNERLPTGLELSSLNPAFSADPDTPLRRVRDECPVRRDEQTGMFSLSRYAHIRELLADRSLLKDPEKAEPAAWMMRAFLDTPEGAQGGEVKNILFLDDPDHARVRGAIAKAFYRRIAASRAIVERVVSETLDGMKDRKRFDVMAEFAVPIPIDVIAHILGADQSMLADFRRWSVDSFEFFNPARTPEQTERMIAGSNALYGYIAELMERKRKSPTDDLVSDLIGIAAQDGTLSDADIRENCAGLLSAGNLTTTDLIGNGIWLLLTHPEERAKLAADPGLINNGVEEILRYEPPVEITARIASRDLEIGGCPIKHTQAIATSLRSANRDPEAFADPDRFDIARKHVPHMSFGGGAHICIGAPLARMEAQVAIPAFLARFPSIKVDAEKPQWRSLPYFRGLQRLDVRTS
jgi:cytochrome P450